ncbi:MAG: spermidine synthase [Dissulfurispiraceae bacterium]
MSSKVIYNFTIFLSAFLLFQIQPLIAKMILPWFGGVAAVWITCMLFFQLFLLGGYIYAHWLINNLTSKNQMATHILLLSLSILLLPVMPNRQLLTLDNLDPALQLLRLLLTSVGMPYFLLSTTTPLIQSWYSRTYQRAMPYRLFALSNFASLLGLLAYPFIVEPNLTLPQQSNSWSALYIAFAVACAGAALHSLKTRNDVIIQVDATNKLMAEESAAPRTEDRILWLLLSTCSSVMLFSTTNYLTQNLASIPFLWILPLSLYLLSFTLCFDRSGWYRRTWYVWIISAVLGGMSYALTDWERPYPIGVSIPFFCTGLFAVCMFCHGELATRKPNPRHLTTFYLMIATGGALGGIFVGILVPKTLTGPFELVLALIACALLLFIVNFRRNRLTAILCAALIAGVLIESGTYIYSFTKKSRLLARNFYGCLKVDEFDKGTSEEHRWLVHGTIIHGVQFLDSKRRYEPVSYYAPSSGIGLAIRNLPEGPRRVGIIGLGTGSLSTYARAGDIYRFYDINPLVKNVALNDFFYLSDCKGKVDILIGDGRLLLEQESDQHYDLLVVDAFSSDSIPVHLLTIEAIQLYFRHLTPDGILALHISNRYLDLAPVIELIRSKLNKQAILINSEGDDHKGIYRSDWVLMTSSRNLLKIPEIKKVARELRSQPGLRAWTDNYSNLIQIVKFK